MKLNQPKRENCTIFYIRDFKYWRKDADIQVLNMLSDSPC